MKFSPLPCYLIPLRPKYYSQTPSTYIPKFILMDTFYICSFWCNMFC
jgi:hypothetical protein